MTRTHTRSIGSARSLFQASVLVRFAAAIVLTLLLWAAIFWAWQ